MSVIIKGLDYEIPYDVFEYPPIIIAKQKLQKVQDAQTSTGRYNIMCLFP